MPMPVCPKCHSLHVETRNCARKLGGGIGAASGATSAVLMAVAKARATAGLVEAVNKAKEEHQLRLATRVNQLAPAHEGDTQNEPS